MRHRPVDLRPVPGLAEPVLASVHGTATGRRLWHPQRTVVVTTSRVVVLDGDRPVADLPRCAVEARPNPPDELEVAAADQRFTLRLPVEEQEHERTLLEALRHEPFLAWLGPVDLPHRTRRALALDDHEHCAFLLTRHRLVLLVRRGIRTEIGFSRPRSAVRVRSHQTVWPGGDLVFNRIVLDAGGTVVELDVEHQLHDRACAFVAALGGTGGPPPPPRPTGKANP